MSNSDQSSENQNVDSNGDSKGQAHEVSSAGFDVNKDPIPIGIWTRGHSLYTLKENLSTFCLFLKTV